MQPLASVCRKPADTDVTVTYKTADATATAGDDYTSTNGTLTILAGQTSGTISVPVIDDSVPDEGNEMFYVNLLGATGAEIVDGQGQGTIVDNDGTNRRRRSRSTMWQSVRAEPARQPHSDLP